ncbi:MAG: hypothetical protein SOR81_04630 [Fusobacterium sp.]|uniref:hypothetical protein n=1 Tax=Fusobacterium sp. TaxID=68766 RepID=UPI002A755309|nr:hypothetical protein [Fusobacterium sp.]MDY2980880.1 hypothetical protein [Fusobacterium sp.]
MRKTTIFRNFFFNIIIFMISIFITFLIILDSNEIYKSVAILPFFFALNYLVSLLFISLKTLKNIGYFLFWGQSFVKCIAAPLFLYLGNYSSLFFYLNSQYIFYGSILLVWEQIACTIIIIVCDKRSIKLNTKKIRKFKLSQTKCVVLFSLFIILLWIGIPNLKNNFVTIFDMTSSKEMFYGYNYVSEGVIGISRGLTTLFLVLFKSFRIIIPIYIIEKLYKKYGNFYSFVLSMIVVLLQFLFIPETVAMPLIVAFILLIYMIELYKQYKTQLIFIIGIGVLFIVFVLSLNFKKMVEWYGIRNISEYISQILQSYV